MGQREKLRRLMYVTSGIAMPVGISPVDILEELRGE